MALAMSSSFDKVSSEDNQALPAVTKKFTYTCIHTCLCLNKTINGDTALVFGGWSSCQAHAMDADRHPKCSTSCPVFSAMRPQNDNTGVRVKLNRDDFGLEEGNSNSLITGGFRTKNDAQVHIGKASKRRDCTRSCPAYHGADPLETPVNGYTTQSDENHRAGHKRGSSPSRHGSKTSPSAKKAYLPSLSRERSAPGEDGDMPSSSMSPSSDIHLTDAYISAHRGEILQRLSVLKKLRNQLAHLPPELQHLYSSLCLLSCTTPETRHYAYPTRELGSSDASVTAEFIFMSKAVIDSVKGVDQGLQEVIEADDGCLPKLRELRRNVSGVYDDLLDLRFDLMEISNKGGPEGLAREKEDIKIAVDSISDELTEIGDKMEELLLEVIKRLLEAQM